MIDIHRLSQSVVAYNSTSNPIIRIWLCRGDMVDLRASIARWTAPSGSDPITVAGVPISDAGQGGISRAVRADYTSVPWRVLVS